MFIPDNTDILSLSPKPRLQNNNKTKSSKAFNKTKNKPDAANSEIIKARIERNKSQYKEILTIFRKLYPNSFSTTMKPLAVGIHKELLVKGAIRVNLDGSEHSKVTKDQVLQKKQYKPKRYVIYKSYFFFGRHGVQTIILATSMEFSFC